MKIELLSKKQTRNIENIPGNKLIIQNNKKTLIHFKKMQTRDESKTKLSQQTLSPHYQTYRSQKSKKQDKPINLKDIIRKERKLMQN